MVASGLQCDGVLISDTSVVRIGRLGNPTVILQTAITTMLTITVVTRVVIPITMKKKK